MASLAEALRAMTLADNRELAFICADVLAELGIAEPGVEVIEYNCVSVAIDRNDSTVTFQGILSVNDETITVPADRFIEEAGALAEERSPAEVNGWLERRRRSAWPMPPSA